MELLNYPLHLSELESNDGPFRDPWHELLVCVLERCSEPITIGNMASIFSELLQMYGSNEGALEAIEDGLVEIVFNPFH